MDKSKAYDILNLPSTASESEVKTAYKALAQKYNVDNYEAGPLREDAEKKMEEINEAFDILMSYLRTGTTQEATKPIDSSGGETGGRYHAIRQMINNGQADEALAELSAMQGTRNDAEWNFLMGSAYYHKGWLDQALTYFQKAAQLEPHNREYQAALRNLQGNSTGDMPGNPYGGQNTQAQALNCACNTCSMILCMDACCGCMRGC